MFNPVTNLSLRSWRDRRYLPWTLPSLLAIFQTPSVIVTSMSYSPSFNFCSGFRENDIRPWCWLCDAQPLFFSQGSTKLAEWLEEISPPRRYLSYQSLKPSPRTIQGAPQLLTPSPEINLHMAVYYQIRQSLGENYWRRLKSTICRNNELRF